MPTDDLAKAFGEIAGSNESAWRASGEATNSGRPPPLQPGATLGDRYVVGELLGEGPRGAVYDAEDRDRGRRTALKVLDGGPWTPTGETRPRMPALPTLEDYAHVVQVHDVGVVRRQGRWLRLIAMECADGGTLRAWLDQRVDQPEDRVERGVALLQQACRGVTALHQAGVLHLNLKPENLLLCDDALKVADPLGSDADPRCAAPEYMPPEQFAASTAAALTPSSDVYALGCILYEMLHPRLQRPILGDRDMLAQRHASVDATPVPGAPVHLQHALDRCLAKDPALRFTSTEQLRCALAGERPVLDEHAALRELFTAYVRGGADEAVAFAAVWLERDGANDLVQAVQRALTQRVRRADGLLAGSMSLWESGNLSLALDVLREVAVANPQTPAVAAAIGRLTVRVREFRHCVQRLVAAACAGRRTTALAAARTALELNRNCPRLERAEAMLQRLGDRLDVVRAALETAMAERRFDQVLALTQSFDQKMTTMAQRWLQSGDAR